MRILDVKEIKNKIKEAYLDICINMDKSVLKALENANLDNKTELFVRDILCKNAYIAKEKTAPLCQDTGMAVIFVDIGQEVNIINGDLEEEINLAVKEAYEEGYFRKSVLDPITRKNTLDNTPAVIHYSIVKGDKVKISCMAKGFGSENMSKLHMLTPSVGLEGIKSAIIDTVSSAKGNPCPPIIVGVGIGGTMEKASLMSKKVLMRDIETENNDPFLNELEKELLIKINNLDIGVGGYGGKLTALKVLIERYPTHLAGMPVAITIQCHASRHKVIIL